MKTRVSDKAILKNRKEWIDALRALAMFFVILGHQMKGITPYYVFTSPIKIPLFFMITGYVFNYNRKSGRDFFNNLFFKIIVPWLCLTVPFVLIRAPFKGLSVIPSGLFKIISGEYVWFMPCCIIAEIIWFVICKYMNNSILVSISAVCVAVVGFILSAFNILDFAMLNRAMEAQLFILLGYLYKNNEQKLLRINKSVIALLIIVYILMGMVSLKIWPHSNLDFHLSRYYNYPFCIIMILLGCVTIFLLAEKLSEEANLKIPGIICFLGQNTLVYYMLHTYNIIALSAALSIFSIQMPNSIFICIKVVFAYIMCWIETVIILRFVPQVLGRKKRY